MAHFAQLDENGVVLQVIVVNNDELIDNGQESESKGIVFCQALLGGNWKQTSYNGKIRKNYAGVGFIYDANRDAFVPPKPYTSWILDEQTCKWKAPIQQPEDGRFYRWDEPTISWKPME